MCKNKADPCDAVAQHLLLHHSAMGPQIKPSQRMTLKGDHSVKPW